MARPFEGVLGNTCELRLLESLLPLDDMGFNVTELSEEAGVSRVTAGRVVKKFVEWGILNADNRKVTNYSLNRSSPIVRSLESLNNALIGRMLGEGEVEEIRNHLREHGRGSVSQLSYKHDTPGRTDALEVRDRDGSDPSRKTGES